MKNRKKTRRIILNKYMTKDIIESCTFILYCSATIIFIAMNMLANTISTIQTTIIDSNILEKLIIFIDSYTEIFDGIFGSVFGLVPLLLMSLTFIQAEALKQKIIEIKNRGV